MIAFDCLRRQLHVDMLCEELLQECGERFRKLRYNRGAGFRQIAFLLFFDPPRGLCIAGFLLCGEARFVDAFALLARRSGLGELVEPYRLARVVFTFVE